VNNGNATVALDYAAFEMRDDQWCGPYAKDSSGISAYTWQHPEYRFVAAPSWQKAGGLVRFSLPGGAANPVVFDCKGRAVGRVNCEQGQCTWDAGRVPAGLYVLNAVQGNTVFSRKIALQR
jgi:hypothetical protein